MLNFDETKQMELPELVEYLSLMDSYIYTLRKNLQKLSDDTTSTAYQFAFGMMEMMKETRSELVGDYARTALGTLPTEIIAEIFERSVLDFPKPV